MTTDIEAIAACGARFAELVAERDALLTLMREARDDFHGKAVLFSSRYLDAIRQTP